MSNCPIHSQGHWDSEENHPNHGHTEGDEVKTEPTCLDSQPFPLNMGSEVFLAPVGSLHWMVGLNGSLDWMMRFWALYTSSTCLSWLGVRQAAVQSFVPYIMWPRPVLSLSVSVLDCAWDRLEDSEGPLPPSPLLETPRPFHSPPSTTPAPAGCGPRRKVAFMKACHTGGTQEESSGKYRISSMESSWDDSPPSNIPILWGKPQLSQMKSFDLQSKGRR